MYELQHVLVDYEMAMLRVLAQHWGASLTTNRKIEAADQLAAVQLDPFAVRVVVAQLSRQARDALDALLAAQGKMRTTQFERAYGAVRRIGPGRLSRDKPWQDPKGPAEELFYAGLTFRAFFQDESGMGEFWFVPIDLQPLLPQPETRGSAFFVETVPGPEPDREDSMSLVRDLFTYLLYVQTHDVCTGPDGQPGQREQESLRCELDDREGLRLALVGHLAAQLGLVAPENNLLRLNAAAVKRWLTAPPISQLSILQEAWRDDPDWNDLCRVPTLVCEPETGWLAHYDPVAVRQAILSLLGRCPADGWWLLSSFVNAVKSAQPDFQRPDGDYTSWYIRDAETKAYLSGFDSWDQVEGVLLRHLLSDVLGWLGIVETTVTERGTACHLTRSGRALLGLETVEPQEVPSPPIIVRPDFFVELPPPPSLYVRFQLERLADLKGEDPCTYHLTVDSLGRAFARGIQAEPVLTFLRQASNDRVPAAVAAQLVVWAERFDSVDLKEMTLLTVKDEHVMRELAALPRVRSLLGQVVSPRQVLVRNVHLSQLERILHREGFLRRSARGDVEQYG